MTRHWHHSFPRKNNTHSIQIRLERVQSTIIRGTDHIHVRSSPTKSLLQTSTTMTLHSKTCSTEHIEHMPITLHEKTCLSVCRRRQCPIEQGDLLEIDRGGEHQSSEAQIRTLLDDQKEHILAEFQARINQHEFQAGRAGEQQRLLQGQLWQQKLEFREAHQRSLTDMEELRKFQSSTFDTIARRKFVEDQNTILELTGRVQELQNEVNCMNDSKDFQDAESIRSGNSHVTSRPVSFPTHPIPEGMLSPSFVSPRRKEGPPSIWDTHGISGNVFANPDASSSAPYPQELHQWNSSVEKPLHSSTVEKSERQKQDQDLRYQSGPSAKNSVIFSGGDSSKNYGADQQRLQISDLHFDKFPTPATFACWKIRFKIEVCTCSQFSTEAMQWIKRSGDG